MNKKKIIIPILIVLIVVLFAIGIFSYANYNSKPKINTNYGSDYDPVEESTEYMTSQYSSPEEVLNEIQSNITEDGVTVSYTKEEDGCWCYEDSKGYEYYYCEANPTIIKVDKKEEKN